MSASDNHDASGTPTAHCGARDKDSAAITTCAGLAGTSLAALPPGPPQPARRRESIAAKSWENHRWTRQWLRYQPAGR